MCLTHSILIVFRYRRENIFLTNLTFNFFFHFHLYYVVILILLNFISIVYVFQTKGNPNCGNSKWQAARVYSGPTKNLRATGLEMCCCRHRVILKAANMYQPENYQHTHFVHSKLAIKNYRFICGDVMCKYKFFARRSLKLRDRKGRRRFPMMKASKYFLSRMHAKAHAWYCSVGISQ